MKKILVSVAVALLALTVVFVDAADKDVTVGDITAKVLGHSGKIKMYKSDDTDPNMITMTYDYIKELTDTGEAMTGSHSYNNFAQLDFEFSDITNSTFGDSGVDVTEFTFTATIEVETGETATLVSYVYMFTEDGNITVNGDTIEVKSGDLKFNVEITNWPFCGQGDVTCSQGQTTLTGGFLEFAIEIKGSGTTEKQTGGSADGPDKYDLGGGATVIVPKTVIYNGGSPVDMPTGYPALEIIGSKSLFVFRFEKFTTSVLYDPVASTGANDTPDEPEEEEITQSGISAKVLGHSGKMQIKSTAAGDSGNVITVEFVDLSEKTATGDVINDNAHKFNGFANQVFTINPVVEEQYESIDVQRLTFTSTLSNGATLTINMYVFKADGSITNGDETIDVVEGSVKFNIDIQNWGFCSDTVTCTQAGQAVMGQFLDFGILIKGKSAGATKGNSAAKKGLKYDLVGGTLTLSEMSKIDGVYAAMPTGYPKKEQQGNKEVFLFRFEKFVSSVMYDPVMTLGSGSGQLRASVTALISLVMLCLWKWL